MRNRFNGFIGHRLTLPSIISDQHRRLVFYGQRSIIFNPDANRLGESPAPIFLRDQPAFAAFRQEPAFDENSRNLGQAQHSESRPLNPTVELGDMSEEGMIDAGRERHTLGIHLASRLDAG